MAMIGAEAVDPASRPYLRLRLVTGLMAMVSAALMLVALLSALFLHSRTLGLAGVILLAVTVLSHAASQGAEIWLLFKHGEWRGLNGIIVRRTEHPTRFWVSIAVRVANVLTAAVVSALLASIALHWPFEP